jgi:hypothetical protein
MFEFPPVGGLVTSSKFRAVKLIRYVDAFDYFVLGCEILFMLFVVYYTIEEALEVNLLIPSIVVLSLSLSLTSTFVSLGSKHEICLFQVGYELLGFNCHHTCVCLHVI